MKSALPILLIIAALYFWFQPGDDTPKPGTVFELTSENFATAKRTSTHVLGVYLDSDSVSTQISRSLAGLATRLSTAGVIVAYGDRQNAPGLAAMATIQHYPTFVVYEAGVEQERLEGEFAPKGLDGLIERHFSGK